MSTATAEKLRFMADELADLESKGLRASIRTVESPQGAWLQVDGKRVLNLASNNYLGLANHPHLVEACKMAMEQYGVGPAAVRTIAGTMSLHVDLEQRLARFKGAEAVIALQSGFTANQAALGSVVGREDAIFSDELNHASIIDGARLSRAKIIVYPHNDAVALANVLERETEYRRRLIVTDGVFSMDGDIAPLADLADVADRYGCLLMVDDAHGEGVVGRGGRGIIDHFGLHGRVDIEVGTLSKAFGVVGGFIAGPKLLVDYVRTRARPNLFSSAMTVPDTAAALASIDLMEASTDLVDRLWANARFFQDTLRGLGFDLGKTQTPITPVILGDAPLAKDFARRLYERGLFTVAIGFPTVALGQARIRVMPSATHSQDDLAFAAEQFAAVGRELRVVG
ncbi:MAG: glycine C-acetyltransferase [Anaerolineae bacterium]|nr:glycine C-acetyltransferase [Anaerolineae bacterium]